jgi:hypothetical protein
LRWIFQSSKTKLAGLHQFTAEIAETAVLKEKYCL